MPRNYVASLLLVDFSQLFVTCSTRIWAAPGNKARNYERGSSSTMLKIDSDYHWSFSIHTLTGRGSI